MTDQKLTYGSTTGRQIFPNNETRQERYTNVLSFVTNAIKWRKK